MTEPHVIGWVVDENVPHSHNSSPRYCDDYIAALEHEILTADTADNRTGAARLEELQRSFGVRRTAPGGPQAPDQTTHKTIAELLVPPRSAEQLKVDQAIETAMTRLTELVHKYWQAVIFFREGEELPEGWKVEKLSLGNWKVTNRQDNKFVSLEFTTDGMPLYTSLQGFIVTDGQFSKF